jgi:hypothetical protein
MKTAKAARVEAIVAEKKRLAEEKRIAEEKEAKRIAEEKRKLEEAASSTSCNLFGLEWKDYNFGA